MKKQQNQDTQVIDNVPNNPRYDRKNSFRKGMDARAIKDAEDNTLYDMNQLIKDKVSKRLQEIYKEDRYRTTISGRRVPFDEPTEPTKTQYPKVDKKQYDKDMEFWKSRNRTAVAQNRLKKRGDEYVPKKSGKKMFEDFMRDMREATASTKQQNIDDADLRNIYNAATQLDYRRWLIWIADEYSSRI